MKAKETMFLNVIILLWLNYVLGILMHSYRQKVRYIQILVLIILREKILVWIRIRTRVSSSMRWLSNQLSHPDNPLGQARILLLLDCVFYGHMIP